METKHASKGAMKPGIFGTQVTIEQFIGKRTQCAHCNAVIKTGQTSVACYRRGRVVARFCSEDCQSTYETKVCV